MPIEPYNGEIMQIVVHPLEDQTTQVQYAVLFAEHSDDATALRRFTLLNSKELQGYNLGTPINEVELRMPRHINEMALVGAVQRTVGCRCTKIEPPKHLQMLAIVPATAGSSSGA